MAIRNKGSRKIIVEDQEFRWLASGNDYGIDVLIWPTSNKNAISKATLDYHYSESGKTLAVTNRIIKVVILYFGVKKLLTSNGDFQLGRVEDIFPVAEGVWQGPSLKPCPSCGERHGSF